MFTNKIIFISYNSIYPSDHMRVHQIINILNNNDVITYPQYNKDTNTINESLYHQIKEYRNSLFIWVWKINIDLIKKINNSNHHVFDIIDSYVYDYNNINNLLNLNLLDGIIVNNKYTLNYLYSKTNFTGLIDIIYHHYDPIFESAILNNQQNLIFGYMGSIPSLYHSNNFLYFKELINKFPIEMLNSEDGLYYTESIKNNIIIKSQNQKSLTNININFNCHISIRPIDCNISKFKTSAKIATAAYFGHNIITTNEECVKDLLSDDYPFILRESDYNSVCNMFKIVIDDYNNQKVLWNKGLNIMLKIKNRLKIDNIKNDYIKLINRYI